MGTGRPRMPSLPRTYENRGSDQLSQRHSKDSQLSGPTVAGAAHRRSRSNVFRSTGMVLKTTACDPPIRRVIGRIGAVSILITRHDLARNRETGGTVAPQTPSKVP